MSRRWLGPGAEWRRALAALRHDVYHLPEWSALEAELAGAEARAFLFRDGGNSFLLPLLLRPVPDSELRDAGSPYGYPGPLTTTADPGFGAAAAGALIQELSELELVAAFVRLHPLLGVAPATLAAHGRVLRHGETVAIDLQRSEEEIWGGLRLNHRRDIRRARRDGLTARIDGGGERFPEFVDLYGSTMARRRAADSYRFPRSYFDGLRQRLGDRLRLCVVESAGELACAGLFTVVDKLVQYHLSGTSERFLDASPTKLMFDHVWRWARAEGAAVLHLGGGLGSRDNSLFRFKAGFSAWRLAFHTWRLVPRPDAYRELVRAARPDADPDDLGGFFPAYRAPAPP